MNAMVRSRSTVMRLVRDTPGRRVSFMLRLLALRGCESLPARAASASHIVVSGGKGTKRHAWRPCQTALGSLSNLEDALDAEALVRRGVCPCGVERSAAWRGAGAGAHFGAVDQADRTVSGRWPARHRRPRGRPALAGACGPDRCDRESR